MKVLFLDWDGVLNCAYGMSATLDYDLVYHLNRVVGRTGCKVVLTTDWRLHLSMAEVKEKMRLAGFHHEGAIVGKTPSLLKPAGRHYEISAWLNAYGKDVTSYAIVDDCWIGDTDTHELRLRFVRTSKLTGLTEEKAEELVALLNAPMG